MSQADLSRLTKISKVQWNFWLTGSRSPTIKSLQTLADQLEMKLVEITDWFLIKRGQPEPKRNPVPITKEAFLCATIQELAEFSGLSCSIWRKLLRQKRSPRLANIEKYAACLGLPTVVFLEWLIERKGEL